LPLTKGVETDGLFTVEEQYELAELIPNSQLEFIKSGDGHDGFLLEFDQMQALLNGFIRKHAPAALFETVELEEGGEEKGKEVKNSLFGEQEDILMW
jgi:homoserine O-acetyltransferase/O-succinyltransferase